ncbi:MAG TPA: ABC transporter ATP-binding protein [Egibacteraceae bacterium]|nr:ABC transporter ATP-binding protein [Egibacteraceae bacterium]
MSLHAHVVADVGALHLDVRLHAAAGEVVAVLGPNGAGKTTLLRALAGLVPLSAGRVVLDGRVLEDPATASRRTAEDRDVGFVFQDHLLFPNLSVLDNVAFGLRCRGVRKGRAREIAAAWIGRVELASLAQARPGALSGGQAQRVALARALACSPALLLLDEPLAALDVQARQSMRRLLRRHLDAFGGPCVIVTHQPLEAIALADRLVIVEQGVVVQDGAAAEVARRPRSRWVARLVGLNLYRGTARDHTVALEGGGSLRTADAAGGEVFATVHPRAVALHPEAPRGSPRNAWRGTVAEIDLHGDHVRVHVEGPIPIVAEITPAGLADLSLSEGQPTWVSVKASAVDLFPR